MVSPRRARVARALFTLQLPLNLPELLLRETVRKELGDAPDAILQSFSARLCLCACVRAHVPVLVLVLALVRALGTFVTSLHGVCTCASIGTVRLCAPACAFA